MASGSGVSLGTGADVWLDAFSSVETRGPAEGALAELAVVALLAAALLPVAVYAGAAVLAATKLWKSRKCVGEYNHIY